MRKPAALAVLLLIAGCTPGAPATPPGGGGGGGGGGGKTVTISVNLTLNAPVPTSAGESGGFAPPVTNVSIGDKIVFKNTDGFSHTATLIGQRAKFPAGSPFSVSAQTQSGSDLSGPWSSGTLTAGSASQEITVDQAGTYLYGCFYHYGAPMRGMIVAK